MLAITFTNISNLAEISDYSYRVLLAGESGIKLIETGFVKGHARAEGWEQLVRRLLDTREMTHE